MKQRKRSSNQSSFITIPLPLYHLHVVIAHGVTLDQCYVHAKKHGCKVDQEWLQDVKETADGAAGFCSNLGKGNTDVLVWLKNSLHQKSKSSESGVLWHELFHAVQKIQKSLACEGEQEFGAYLFEHLAESACNVFWSTKPPKKRKT